MLRDDNIAKIKERLDSMIQDSTKNDTYKTILNLANHNMNLEIHTDSEGKHQVLWYNRKLNGSFDEHLQTLVEYIDYLEST